MADRKKAVGSDDAPGSKVAKEQRGSGTSGGPQEGRDEARTPKQSSQTSSRGVKAHEHEPTVREGYEAAQNPEPQGDGDPGPEQITET